MNELSPIVKVEKNKLTSGSVWLVALEINIPSVDETIRIVNNNEDIEWNSYTWQRFPFELDEVSENGNAEISQFQIRVANVNNVIGEYLQRYDVYIKENGFEAITINLFVLNSKDLGNTEAVYSASLVLASSSISRTEVTFTVSAKNLYNAITPISRMFPNRCRFKFKSIQCGYGGNEESCSKNLARCRELNNSSRFGGFPLVGTGGVNV